MPNCFCRSSVFIRLTEVNRKFIKKLIFYRHLARTVQTWLQPRQLSSDNRVVHILAIMLCQCQLVTNLQLHHQQQLQIETRYCPHNLILASSSWRFCLTLNSAADKLVSITSPSDFSSSLHHSQQRSTLTETGKCWPGMQHACDK